MNRQRYPTDLTDAQWAVLAPLIPPAKPGGRPRAMAMREIVNAILYVTRTGIPWEERPHDFPKWQTVSAYHRLWLDEGVWEAINDARRRLVRVKERREPAPTAGISASQSVKMTALPGWRGSDAGKQVNGRKRSIAVDTLGLLVRVVVHAADLSDAWGAKRVLPLVHDAASRLQHLWGDQHYGGKLADWARETCGWEIEIIRRPAAAEGFEVLPTRWIVECTFGWLGWYRRLSKDYEVLTGVAAAFIYAAMIHLMLRRLAA